MNTIIKPNSSQYLLYDPSISSNSVIPANHSAPLEYKEVYLRILNYLSEFKTPILKKTARDNLDVYDKGTVNEINTRVVGLREDLGNKEDSPNQTGNAFERINYLIEVIIELLGDGDTSIAGLIRTAINDLKGGVSSEYDTQGKIESIIKAHLLDYNNPHKVTKELVGLGNLTNDALVKRSEMGKAGGVATLTSGGTVPPELLPSYVDDVIDCYATFDKDENGLLTNIKLYKELEHSTPIEGEAGKIYADVVTSYLFRWTGTQWSVVGAPTVIGTAEGTAFDGKRGKDLEDKTNLHILNTNNPHNVTSELVGAIPVGGLKTVNGNELEGEGNIDIIFNADNVLFTSDLVITADVGVHTIDSSGSKTLPTNGKSVKQVMDLLFSEEKNPNIVLPSVNLTSSSMGSKEVGTRVTPNYNATLNPGSYLFGPATNVTATSCTVTDTAGGTKNTGTGNFSELQVTDSTNYSITAVINHTEGAIPLTNLGNEYAQGLILAGSKTKTLGSITGHRKTFYGTVESKETPIDSSLIRGLAGKSSNALANGAKFDINIPIGAIRIIIAYPSTLQDLTQVLDVNGFNTPILSEFLRNKTTVLVEGANNYEAKEYKLFYMDYANPNDVVNTYKVTI